MRDSDKTVISGSYPIQGERFYLALSHSGSTINMKTTAIVCALTASLFAGCMTEEHEHEHHHNQAKLEAEARVSRADAEKIAMDKVPGGTIKEAELEREKGKLIWSFDMATPGTKDVTEVNIDAITGAVIAVDKESAADEAREAKKEKHEKEEDDDKK